MRVARSLPSKSRYSTADLLLFAEAWLSLAAASLRLRIFPFERNMRARSARYSGALPEADLGRLVWAVMAAQRRTWLRAKCIEAALALRSLLHRRGVATTLHYGIRTVGGELEAHVWLSVDGTILIGGDAAGQFAEVTSFRTPLP